MARKRISEFRTKTLIYQGFGEKYTGIIVNDKRDSLEDMDNIKPYVIKVDQGIKGRFKKGLVKLNQTKDQISTTIKEFHEKGYTQFLIEEQLQYDLELEKYISIERIREGYLVLFSHKGGVNVEDRERPVEKFIITSKNQVREFAQKTGVNENPLHSIFAACDKYFISFLEINPFIILKDYFIPLDAAAEVDNTAEFFVAGAWHNTDFTEGLLKQKTEEEIQIQNLADKSQAAFSLEVLNPNGSIFMMLSGGGASIVLADEVRNLGFGKQLANYGEYSGNPNADETYIYAKNLINLLLKSNAEKKVLIIAGGVANFTDVRITFNGLIQALDEAKEKLQKQGIKVFVRRGGPYQEEGLSHINQFLKDNNLFGIVSGPEMVLTDIVSAAISNIKD